MTEMAGGTYEFYYNWDYAQKHRPHLMSLGRGGNLNEVRREMVRATRNKKEDVAERCFWELVQQNDIDASLRFPLDKPRTSDDLHQLWLADALEMDSELYYFIRKVEVSRPRWLRWFYFFAGERD